MKEQLEFIVNSIIAISELDRMESFSDGVVMMEASKKTIFSNKKIKIMLSRSKADNKNSARVTAENNGRIITDDILKEILYDLFRRTGMLDDKLKMKLDMLFNDGEIGHFRFNDGVLRLKEDFGELLVEGYRTHLDESWPQIKDKIKIELKYDNGEKHILITQNLGWQDDDFFSFLIFGIALDAALENCATCGIKKIVIIFNNEFQSFTLEQLSELAHKHR